MRRFMVGAMSAVLLAVGACGGEDEEGSGGAPAGGRNVILATTTSTQDSGLLDVLVPAFERDTARQVKTLAVGSGQALELGERGEADVVLVHSPEAEEEFMAAGKGGERRLVMHNDFVIVGPRDDPAAIRARSPEAALARIARRQERFVSRGDDSGTHTAELRLWEEAGMEPGGDWYEETGQGMGATLRVADQRGGHTLSDRGTYLTQPGELVVLVEGDAALLNVYHVIDIAAEAGPRVNVAGGREFAKWIVAPEAQAMIGSFGEEEYGEPLFTPDAGKTDAEVLTSG